jgi:hypothetical protein
MKSTHPPQGDNRPPTMTLQRLRQLLDAYGASPDRWPAEERAAAVALLADSVEVQSQRDAAACLDALLDLAPVVPPSTELAARVLAATPVQETQTESNHEPMRRLRAGRRYRSGVARRNGTRKRRSRVWPSLAVAASLAAVLWGVWNQPSTRQELQPEVIANLGVYTTPTDVLLQWPGADLFDTLPSVGCTDSELGCPELNVSPGAESRSLKIERRYV